MKIILILLSFLALFPVFGLGQGSPGATTTNGTQTKSETKRAPVFRPTKDQIRQVQSILKEKALYRGEATGTYNADTRASIKSFQKDNGLRETGTLNRATLEKMNIELTEAQKNIPVLESSFASAKPEKKPARTEKASASTDARAKKAPIFRATVDQIKEAQRILKVGAMYDGEQTGKLDTSTRNGLKKFQEANGLKVTGTLNQVTLEKMGVALTDKQKATGEARQ
ncbi:MAG TPA: peptidoglycan-binding domain-containing protein [Pyrinomonadaceae bacterium]|nr:peptidoglycan-binding domain-containing protein [Pyrinomonadaceae bacterium]